MTRILSFNIDGLGGRKKPLSLELTPNVNVLWGLNGSGKTSALKILHSALNNDARPLANVPFIRATVTFQSRPGGPVVTRSVQKKDLEDLPTTAAEAVLRNIRIAGTTWGDYFGEGSLPPAQWHTAPDDARQKDIAHPHTYLNISRISEGTRRKRSTNATQSLDEAQYDQIFATQVREIWERYTTESLEKIGRAQEGGIADILSAALRGQSATMRQASSLRFNEEEAYSLIQDFFKRSRVNLRLGSFDDFVMNYRTEPFLRTTVAIIFEVQNEIDTVQLPQRRLEELISNLFAGGKQIKFDGRQLSIAMGKENLELESLSSGEKQILRLLIETIAAGENSVLVDEPEISLHVDWQYRLVQSMQTVNPLAQLILATHSPEVMATLPDQQIFQL